MTPDAWQHAVAAIDNNARVIDSDLAKLRRSVSVEGEDATSGFAQVDWALANGEIVKSREAWNGGCCSSPTATDRYFVDGKVVREIFFIAPRNESARLLQGAEPRSRVDLRVRDYAPGGEVLRQQRDAVLDATDREP